MPYTDKLHSDLNLKRLEVGQVIKDCQALAKSIEQLLQDFVERHGGDLDGAWAGINDSLSDLLDDAIQHQMRDIEELDQRIAEIEAADLRRSAPVTL